jgi:small subunit ribosomal protein S14
MAKTSMVERDLKRRRMAKRDDAKRKTLKAMVRDKTQPMDERFAAVLKLAALPRNGSKTRIRNRCELSGRARGFYRKLKMSRIALRELSSTGMIPGMVKSSW